MRHASLKLLLTSAVLAAASNSLHAQDAKTARGKELFTEAATPPCAVCHTLSDAQAEGAIGPNLDDLKPDADRVKTVIRSGLGVMPRYDSLSDEDVASLATYVSGAVSK
jgi:cytochrome c6